MAKYLDKNGVQYLWQKIKGAFAPLSHTHTKSQITDFAHTHPASELTGLVKSGEKVISVDANGALQSTLAIAYDSASQKVQLKGLSNEVISEFNAADFIKDGFLDTAELVVVSASQAGTTGYPATAGTYLKFTWNTAAGKSVSWVDVTSLIDVYTAGNGIDITSGAVSIKVDSTQGSNVTVTTSANGLKVEVDQSGKVDKVEGKQLSTEDYTTAEKTKLGNIAAGATADEALTYGSASADIDTAIAAAETAGAIAPGEYTPAS